MNVWEIPWFETLICSLNLHFLLEMYSQIYQIYICLNNVLSAYLSLDIDSFIHQDVHIGLRSARFPKVCAINHYSYPVRLHSSSPFLCAGELFSALILNMGEKERKTILKNGIKRERIKGENKKVWKKIFFALIQGGTCFFCAKNF